MRLSRASGLLISLLMLFDSFSVTKVSAASDLNTLTYEAAKKTNQVYSCEYKIPSLEATEDIIRAKIKGDNYYAAVSSKGTMTPKAPLFECALIDGIAYVSSGAMINTVTVAEEYKKYFNREFKVGMLLAGGFSFFPTIPPSTECTPISETKITPPAATKFMDVTQYYVDGVKAAFESTKSLVDKIPFVSYLPPSIPKPFGSPKFDVIAGQGNADPGRESIVFKYRQIPDIDMQESKLSSDFNPPTDCQELPTIDWKAQGIDRVTERNPCPLIATTQKGYKIYKGNFGSSRMQAGSSNINYYVAIDKTLVQIRGTISEVDLPKFVDSLETVSNRQLINLLAANAPIMPIVPRKEQEVARPPDKSPTLFTVYVPEYTPDNYKISSKYLDDKSKYSEANPHVKFLYIANYGRANEAKYEIQEEKASNEYSPPENCGWKSYEINYSAGSNEKLNKLLRPQRLVGPCKEVGKTVNGENVYHWYDDSGMMDYYFVKKENTTIRLWTLSFQEKPKIDTETAIKIFSSLRKATDDEIAELRKNSGN